MRIVLDTCGLLYWTLEPGRLTTRAAGALSRVGDDLRAVISSATVWEIALKHRAGRLDLGTTPEDYLAQLHRLPLDIEPVDAELWLRSVALPWEHRDPVDRLVVALARREAAEIITSNREIRAFEPRCVW